MKVFLKNQILHKYLPLTLTLVLLVASGFVYLVYKHSQTTEAAWANGYSYRRTITIDRTKVPNTDQTNFPMLITGTFSYLATAANGGNVQNSSGFDIIFTSDAAGSTLLSW